MARPVGQQAHFTRDACASAGAHLRRSLQGRWARGIATGATASSIGHGDARPAQHPPSAAGSVTSDINRNEALPTLGDKADIGGNGQKARAAA